MSGATAHWFRMRLSALVLVPMCAWLLWAGVTLVGADHADALAFLARWYNVLLAAVFILAAAYHAQAGIGGVVEDYVPGERIPKMLIGLTRGAFTAVVLLVAWALWRITSMGAV